MASAKAVTTSVRHQLLGWAVVYFVVLIALVLLPAVLRGDDYKVTNRTHKYTVVNRTATVPTPVATASTTNTLTLDGVTYVRRSDDVYYPLTGEPSAVKGISPTVGGSAVVQSSCVGGTCASPASVSTSPSRPIFRSRRTP